MNNPDAIVLVRGDPGNLPKDPIVRQWLGPERIHLELGYWSGCTLCKRQDQQDGKGFHRAGSIFDAL
jgi:hypothetical protein